MSTIKGFATGTVPQPAGTTALDTRKANAFRVASDAAGVPRTGVLGTNPSIVTTDASTAPMRVSVAKAGFVTSRSVGDGVIDWGNDGSIFVTVTKPLSNRHIVVVYAKHNDAGVGDPTSLPVVEAVAGAASATPAKPAIPSGAEELATLDIPSTATSTQSAGVVLTNTYKMTAAAGGVVHLRNSAELAAWAPADGNTAWQIDAAVIYLRTGAAWRPLTKAPQGAWTLSAPQGVGSGVFVFVPIATAVGTPDAGITNVGGVVTFARAGTVDATAQVVWNGTGGTRRHVIATINGATIDAGGNVAGGGRVVGSVVSPPVGSDYTMQLKPPPFEVAAGDVLRIFAFHDAGTPCSVNPGSETTFLGRTTLVVRQIG